VKNQVDRIKSTPFLPKNTAVYGFIYDVRTERLGRVE
jgi:carbonic anhydrase